MQTVRLVDGSTIQVINYVQHWSGREFPWMGYHNGCTQFFKTQLEAISFAKTGRVIPAVT